MPEWLTRLLLNTWQQLPPEDRALFLIGLAADLPPVQLEMAIKGMLIIRVDRIKAGADYGGGGVPIHVYIQIGAQNEENKNGQDQS